MLHLADATVAPSPLNLTGAGALLGSVTARGTRHVRFVALLASLDTGSASFTVTVTRRSAGGGILHRTQYTEGKTINQGTWTIDGPKGASTSVHALPWLLRDGEWLEVEVASTNSGDTAVTAEIEFYDPFDDGLAVGRCEAGSASGTVRLSAFDRGRFGGATLKGCHVEIIAGTGAGQGGRIITGAAVSSSHPVSPAWATTPDATSIYRLRWGPGNVAAIAGDAAAVQTGLLDCNLAQLAGNAAAAVRLRGACDGFPSDYIAADVRKWFSATLDDMHLDDQLKPHVVVDANLDKSGYVLASNGLGPVSIGGVSLPRTIGAIAMATVGKIAESSAGSGSETFSLWGNPALGQMTVTTPNDQGARTAVAITGTFMGSISY